jgi:transcriptional regulator with XRE-family HTH domain
MRGVELKVWREKRGWTQSDLMQELAIGSRQTVTTWEASDRIPRTIELAIIALDQVEACNRRGGYKQQFTPATIANSWFGPIKAHVAATGVE